LQITRQAVITLLIKEKFTTTIATELVDRWMKNRYGGPLRGLVAEQFHLKIYVDMVNTPAFHDDVIAYPAITVISRETPSVTRIAYRPAIDRAELTKLTTLLQAKTLPATGSVRELTTW
jgi:hypothetical protein